MTAASEAAAQTRYPEKPIRIVVGFPAGSTPDVAARLLGQHLAEAMGKPVIVDVVAGAAGNIASERVAKATPDGYTLAMAANAQLVVNPSLYILSYDPVKAFAPVSLAYTSANILVVHNSVAAKTVQELAALARARPGALTFASGGSGSSPHMAGELFKAMAGLDIRQVPYKGVAVAMPDLLAGRVEMMFGPTSIVLPQVREGKLRALAVTSLKRSSLVPDLPTLDESGFPGFEATVWGGLLAPAATPPAVVRRLHVETLKALASVDVRARFSDLGMDIIGSSPEDFATVIRSETVKWAKLIKQSGVKADQ